MRKPWAKVSQSRVRSRQLYDAGISLKPDVVHVHDTDTLAVGVRLKRDTRAFLVWEANELFPEMLVANRKAVSSFVLAYWRNIERTSVEHVDAVITVGDALAAELKRRFPVSPVVVRSVPDLVPMVDRHLLREHLGLPEEAVILLYQGLINHGRGIEQVIDILEHVPGVHFVFQGTGPTLDSVLRYAAASRSSSRIHYAGCVPTHELHKWASGADIGDLLLENTSLNNYLAAPNKLYQYLIAGIPVLASDFPEIAAVVDEGPAGMVADPLNPEAMVRALAQLAEDTDLRATMGARARELAEARYNWGIEKQKLIALYDELALAARSTS
jgi:glycosyltransferase involved in cell wall biosynthesis